MRTAILTALLCSCFLLQSRAHGNLSVTATTSPNTVCAATPNCSCTGDFQSLTFLYRGTSGVTINAYRKVIFSSQNLITSIANVQDGQLITVSGTFRSHTYLVISGLSAPVRIKTSCGNLGLGDIEGPFMLVGYTDNSGNQCTLPLCTGSINLTVTGGTAPYTFKWDNGATSEDIGNLCDGTYSVHVKDRYGNRQYLSITVGRLCACDTMDCSDNDLCTRDECDNGLCLHPPKDCNDRNSCTIDACVNGQCVYSPRCDDQDACTFDKCYHGTCNYIPRQCDDNNPCTADTCVNGQCVFTPMNCDDNDLCTTDFCAPYSGGNWWDWWWNDWFGWGGRDRAMCFHTPISGCQDLCANVVCDDSDACTTDACQNGQCIFSSLDCDDTDACTSDACSGGICSHSPMNCDDNDVCTNDACNGGVCSNTPIPGCGDPCATLVCNDQDDCTTDACVNGQCVFTPLNCDDSDACTVDVCAAGICSSTQVSCDDADACTADACANGQCQFTPVNCDDGDACTTDECIGGSCAYTIIPGCNDPCANIICDDEDECTSDACVNGNCPFTPINCDDGDACTNDGCTAGICSSTPVNCDDGNACTNDVCNSGTCSNTPIAGCGDPCANSSLAVTIAGTEPNPCSSCNGSATANPTGGSGSYSYLWSTGETTQSIGGSQPNGTTTKCINAGGPQYTASNGDLFEQDFYYNGTTFTYTNNTVADIAGTTDDILFRTERNSTSAFTYDIPVVNGQYEVSLYFAEIYYGVAGGTMQNPPFTGKRIFDVAIEGLTVLDDYDINADVGPATATIKTYAVTVTDGQLNILFTPVVNRAKISAICVKPGVSQPTGLCGGNYSVTVTDGSGCTASSSVNFCNVDPCANVVCDDGDACTTDACANGSCVFSAVDCDDNDACTQDACTAGQCTHTGFSVQVSGTAPVSCSDCNGSATATANGAAPFTYLWSTGETTQTIGSTGASTEKCINAGGPQYLASNGETFEADYYYNGVTFAYSNNTVADIAGTTDDALFRTERNTLTSMTYDIPVTNGQYEVSLYFAEIYFGVAGGNTAPPFTGKRVFDVAIEGLAVLDDYDINADVGPATATIKTYAVTVSDGQLNILFTSVINRAKVSAICVKPSGPQSNGLCAGSYFVTVTDANGCTASGEVTFCGSTKLSAEDLGGNKSEDAAVSNLRAYPNPFESRIMVEFQSEVDGKAELRMVDVLGQIVSSETLDVKAGNNQTEVHSDNLLAAGIYFLELRTNGKRQFVKLMKE